MEERRELRDRRVVTDAVSLLFESSLSLASEADDTTAFPPVLRLDLFDVLLSVMVVSSILISEKD